MAGFNYDVFLSFASLNEDLARPLSERLVQCGLEVFWSDEALKYKLGSSWYSEIEACLEASRHFILLWSHEAKRSNFVRMEYEAFHTETLDDESRHLIPVLANGCTLDDLPLFLRRLQVHPLENNPRDLIARLGGEYNSLEIENAVLRRELREAMEKIAHIERSDGPVSSSDFYVLEAKYAALEKKYMEIENRMASLNASVRPSVRGMSNVLIDDHGIEFVLIEPGIFTMGDVGIDSTRPTHTVEITHPFYLGKYPVTQAEWKKIMPVEDSNFKGDKKPIEQVSWFDVQDFLDKIQRNNAVYRLPTEAEWEYACRAGTTTKYSFGDDRAELDTYGWYGFRGGLTTHSVGEKEPNPWGLYDVHGNVWEWVQDWYSPYDHEPVIDPVGPGSGRYRILRGGSWNDDPDKLRSAYRDYQVPGNASGDIGFRLLRTIP